MFRTVFPSINRSLKLQFWAPDDGRKDRPKRVECYSKINKFEKLMHLVGFTIEIYYDARTYKQQILQVHNVYMC